MNQSRIDAIVNALHARAVSFSGYLFRVTSPEYAVVMHLVNGAGAAANGQRWNPPGLRTVYAGLDEATALAESAGRAAGLGIKPSRRRLEVVSFHAEIPKVGLLDAIGVLEPGELNTLTRADHRGRLPGDPLLPGQLLGRAAVAAGLQALVAPSAIHIGGMCIAVFPDVAPRGWADIPPDEP